MLERIENVEDPEMLEEMRKKSLKFKSLEDFLGDRWLEERMSENQETGEKHG